MFFLKRRKLEKKLMQEIRDYAGVRDFPYEDAMIISRILVSYDNGYGFPSFLVMNCTSVIMKYPVLFEHWDEMMIRYKKLGLFPKWEIEE